MDYFHYPGAGFEPRIGKHFMGFLAHLLESREDVRYTPLITELKKGGIPYQFTVRLNVVVAVVLSESLPTPVTVIV